MLGDHLPQPAPDARRSRESHPKGFEPGVRFDGSGLAEVTMTVKDISGDEAAWRDKIQLVTGLTIPDVRECVLTDVRYWGDPGAPMIYAKFQIRDRAGVAGAVDGVQILRDLRAGRRTPTLAFDGDASFGFSLNDTQFGKNAGGGTRATLERIDNQVESLIARAKELRKINRQLGRCVAIGGGDINEGCFIYPNQAFEIDMDRRQQNNTSTAVILDITDRVAPYFSQMTWLVVGGNHGQHRVNGNKVNRSDNDDLLVFENAARAAERDKKLGHVNFVIAQDEQAKTLNVNGWILGTTHGDVYGKNAGGSAEIKARNWFRNQAAGRQPIGDSDLLITHHFHHYFARDWGSCMWVQTPAMDGGSPFFTDFSGEDSQPGMLSWVTHPGSRYTDAVIL